MSAWPGSSEATALVSVVANSSLSKIPSTRAGGQTFSQPSGRTSFHLTEGGLRPHSTGLSVNTHEDDGLVMRATQSSQSGQSRENPMRNSKDGSRSTSRPNTTIQSPYLQPPGSRGSQGTGHRPTSRQQSQHAQQNTLGQPPPTITSTSTSGHSQNMLRRSTNSNSDSGPANGGRIFQAYGTQAAAPRPFQSNAPGAQPSQKQAALQPQPQPPVPAAHARQAEQFPPPHQQLQQQQARAAVAQQQQQAGPRATTALSGARSTQRGTSTGAVGNVLDGLPSSTANQQATAFRPAGSTAGLGLGSGAGASHLHHHAAHFMSGAGPAPNRDMDGALMSFGYDDIPEEDEEFISPVTSNAFSGLTLDQYMQRMVTTPASAAATSGLGVSADSEESAPCSPGNASTRTEEEDSPYSSPAMLSVSSPSLVRHADYRGGNGDGSAARRVARAVVSPNGSVGSMPRLNKCTRGSAGTRMETSSSVMLQRVTSNSLTPAVITSMATSVSAPAGSMGARGSVADPALHARVSSGMGGQPTRTAIGGAPNATFSFLDDAHGGGGLGVDMSVLLDGGSSDDDQSNPTALLDSPRNSRRLSSRASAMAFSNSLDLRPATAAVVSTSSMTRGDPNTPRGLSMVADSGNHHAIIKQVDLGGLSASLFAPNPNSGRETSGSPASTATNLAASADMLAASSPPSPDLPPGRPDRRIAAAIAAGISVGSSGAGTSMLRSTGPSSGDQAHVATAFPGPGSGGGNVSSGGGPSGSGTGGLQKLVLASPKASMSVIPPPWGVSAREGAFVNGQAGDGPGGANNLQALAARPLSSRGRPGAVAAVAAGAGGDGVIVSPGAVAAAVAAARPASGVKWAKMQKQVKTETGAGAPVMDLPPEARLLAAEAQGLTRPPTRQVQSARPPGSRGEMELDPSVWQANIAMQLQRPPSRQKPPPEALHLWTPEQQMGMLASGAGLGRPGGTGRPQSAAPTTYRGTRPASGPSVKAHGPLGEDIAGTSARPPSRQKPPPLSTLLEHDDFPPPPAGLRRQRAGVDQMDVVVSDSSEEDDEDDLDL